MEYVKHYVVDSGNSSIKGFMTSDAVDFDPYLPKLRHNVMRANAKSIYDLADGATGDDEEDEIRDRMVFSHNSYELIRMMQVIGDWAGLDDELPEGHLDQIAPQIAQVLDQRDYVIYQRARLYLGVWEYNGSPNLGDCLARLLRWPVDFQPAEFDELLGLKEDLLKGVISAGTRDRVAMVAAALVTDDVIKAYKAAGPHRVNETVALAHEANYTRRICASLANLDLKPLFDVVAETVDPAKDDVQRKACRDALKRLDLEFHAAATAIKTMGTNENKTVVNRFMAARQAAIDNFPATLPAPTAISAIITAIGSVGTTLADLQTAVVNLPDVATAISIPDLLGTSDDDKARFLVTELNSQNQLANLAFPVKVKLLNALLSGSTDDDDEDAINLILSTSQKRDQAELYQLTAAAGWESLYTSMNGDQYDTMEGYLDQLH